MPCIKTGCHIYLETHGEYFWGDGFKVGNTYYFRITSHETPEFEPIHSHLHFKVLDYDNWYKDRPYNTLIAHENHVVDYGYEGTEIT